MMSWGTVRKIRTGKARNLAFTAAGREIVRELDRKDDEANARKRAALLWEMRGRLIGRRFK